MSPVSLILLSLIWSAALWAAASLLCRLNPTPHQAQAIWRVAAGLMILPFLLAPVLPGMRTGMGGAIPDLPMMEALLVVPGAAADIQPATQLMPSWLTPDRIVVLLLVAGWLVRVVSWFVGQWRLQLLKRHAQFSPLNAATWAGTLGLSRIPDVCHTPSGSPFVAGVTRPVVYLPRGLQACREVQQVIAHECVHLKRGDLVARPIERLVSDLFWFSPFAWGMRGALDYWREAVVDAEAVRLTGDRVAYARALTHTARLSRPVVHLPVAAFILPRKGTLKMRLTHVLHAQTRQPKRLVAAVAIALSLAVPAALAQGIMMKGEVAAAAVYSHAVLDKAKLTSRYGMRLNPITGESAWHNGIDLAEEEGKPIYAPADGQVAFAGPKEGYGNTVDLVVSADTQLRFGQMSVIEVADRQSVKAGDIIGRIGQSGRATGPHLHLEVWHDQRPDDPEAESGLVLATVLRDTTGSAPKAPANAGQQPIPASAPAAPKVESACKKLDNWFNETPTPESWSERLAEAKAANALLGLEISPKSFNPETAIYPKPVYPRAAAASRKSGVCQVLFDIGPDGQPVNADANCSDPVFVESAKAMPNAKFVPAEVDGKPVTLSGVIYPLQYCIE